MNLRSCGFGSNGAGVAVDVFGGGGGGGVESDALKVFCNVFDGDVLGGPWGLHCWKMWREAVVVVMQLKLMLRKSSVMSSAVMSLVVH
uniref:Uncharacterized protein n=1 Tax=Tanacetum cinerariifolium TaxID=118510 RepID=A0A699UUQ4_TANCI|nr:hypothetical protein [Tanacetum cinerariifolium]